jgi:zinc/manganese transport system substrate-binding protein
MTPFWIRLAATIACVAWTSLAHAAKPLRIVAATTDVGAIARAVVGKDARIDVVARADRDPHALEVRPSSMAMAAKADFYLMAGLQLDTWSPEIVRGSRNRDLVVVDCASPIAVLEVPTGKVDKSMGDVHPQGNPHWWLDPANGAKVARFLAEKFGAARPDEAERFRVNAESFAAEIERRMPDWKARVAGREFVEFHRSWVYFAEAFDMRIVGCVEPLPGIPPSAKHLAALADLIRQKRVPVVIRDPYHPGDPVDFLARETGVRQAVLSSACDAPEPTSYLRRFDEAASVLGDAVPPGAGAP